MAKSGNQQSRINKTVVVVTGPTGVGKSNAVYSLPQNSPIEIINADSRQVYKYLKIGTALPSEDELVRFKHHLFAFLEPTEAFSAGRFARKTRQLIDEIHNRNNIPVIVGGTFFYIKALWDGLIEDPEISEALQREIISLSPEAIRKQLQEIDPLSFEKIKPADSYRNQRALAVSIAANQPYSSLPKQNGIYSEFNFNSIYIDKPRDLLYNDINNRVKKMFKIGLIDEIKSLLSQGIPRDCPAFHTIGYREPLEMWDPILDTLLPDQVDGVIEKISQSSRNFAKRQLTWFRNEKRLKKIDHAHAVSLISELL